MEKLKIGKIVGTHALKGELKIRSFSDFNDQRFVVGHKLYLNEIVDPFIIKTVRVHKGNYLISFEGLQDINLVEKYIGYNVYGLKEDVELDDDEYFYDDLIDKGYVDTYRHCNNEKQEYSWVGRTNDGYRYDYGFVSADLKTSILDCRYLHETRKNGLTDHSGIVIELEI